MKFHFNMVGFTGRTSDSESERIAIMGVVTDGSGGALVSDTTRAPGKEKESHAEGADSEILMHEMETTSIPEEKPVGKVKKPLDNNIYSTKKTVAQGMMDLALLTANASQLKLLLKYNTDRTALFFIHISCICISIALQIVVGVLLILNSRYNINRPSHHSRADLVNNLSVVGIFLITVIAVGLLLIWSSAYNINRRSPHCRADFTNNLSVAGIFLITVVNVIASSFSDHHDVRLV